MRAIDVPEEPVNGMIYLIGAVHQGTLMMESGMRSLASGWRLTDAGPVAFEVAYERAIQAASSRPMRSEEVREAVLDTLGDAMTVKWEADRILAVPWLMHISEPGLYLPYGDATDTLTTMGGKTTATPDEFMWCAGALERMHVRIQAAYRLGDVDSMMHEGPQGDVMFKIDLAAAQDRITPLDDGGWDVTDQKGGGTSA